VLAACTESTTASSGSDADPQSLSVTSSDDACELSATEAPAGTLTFSVANTGSQVTEFYVLDADGLAIEGEVENVGPQATRSLVLSLPAGDYTTACKPGMTGEGIRAPFTVTAGDGDAAEVPADQQALAQRAVSSYAAYVRDQSDQLLARTREFVDLYEAGSDDEARALYPLARVHWERIETVAESFGDLDPRMDAREADLEPGQEWTGWHRIEKDLWPGRAEDYTPMTTGERRSVARTLLADTGELDSRIQDMDFSLDQIANGSRGLLEEVATGKVTGEEEYWSRTDLYDFQANVDGARVGFEGVRPILESSDPDLATELDRRFDELQVLLDEHRVGDDGFVSYGALSTEQVKQLADAVNALSEPLSRLTAAVLA
jgi:iron uptake system component EfeO